MSAAAALSVLAADGVTLQVDGAHLIARPADRLTQAHRDMIRAYRPALVELLSSAERRTYRLFLVRHPDGTLMSHSFTPRATLAEVRGWYPDAPSVEPGDTEPVAHSPEQPVSALAPPDPARQAPNARGPVQCATCKHFEPSDTTPEAGCGICALAKAHNWHPVGQWPRVMHSCRHYHTRPNDERN
jgi:hypothetical protein